MLRDDLDPGEAGRPLEHIGLLFWRVPPGYPGRAVVKQIIRARRFISKRYRQANRLDRTANRTPLGIQVG